MSKLIAVSAFVLAILALPPLSLAAPPEGSAPPLVVSPSPLVFEKTTVGNQAQGKDVDLYNEGESIASVDKIAIEGEDATSFMLTMSSCHGPVFPSQHCYFSLVFAPGTPDEKHATVLVTFDDGRPAQSFEISGIAVEPQLTFSPSSYDFGLQRVYESRNAQLQVTNSGEAAVQVNNFEILNGNGAFWTGYSGCLSGSLQPGQTCSVEVNFNAQDAVAYAAELRAGANGYGFTAALNGQGGRAVIEANPNPLDFGALTVGAIGQAQTITVTNSGNIPAGFFIGIVAGGDSGSFQLLSENCTDAQLMPSSSCSAQVRFRPQDAGPKAAYLAFFGDNEGGAMVGLKGEGAAPAVTLAPSAFDFGAQAAGSKSDGHTFAVRNDGTSPLDLSGVSILGTDRDQFVLAGDECSDETLAPGGECVVRVRFAPDSAGAKTARLRVSGDSGSFSATLTGSGNGVAAGADRHAFGFPDLPPPQAARKARHRRFVRGETLSLGKLQRPRRAQVRASTVPR